MNDSGAAQPSLPVLSPQSRERLEVYAALLRKWNRAINLVSPGTLDDLWRRHIRDSAQVFNLRPAGARTWLDMGSGGGLPGLVVAILAQEVAPDLTVDLVESDQRKCAFLQTVVRELRLPSRVIAARIEAISPAKYDVVSARALAGLDKLCAYSEPLLAQSGVCLFLKGAAIAAEAEVARTLFQFDLTLIPSQTDSTGFVAKLVNLKHV